MSRKRIIRRASTWGAVVLLLGCGAVAGAGAALRLDGPREHATSLATLEVDVQASLDGRVELYVPLVDWRVVTDPFRAPFVIVIETRAIDREAAERVFAPHGARSQLETLRADSRDVLADALRRAAIVAVIGGAGGGALAGALLGVVLLRRRYIAAGAVIGIAVSVAVVAWSGAAVGRLDERDLRGASFEGRAAELPALVTFSQQLLHVGSDYERLYARSLDSLDNLRAFARRANRHGDQTLLLASDIHNNEFVLDAFDDFAGGRTVLLAGDYGQVGARIETYLAPQIADLGGDVIAVGGNHDSTRFMETLAEAGATVLGTGGETEVTGLRIVGYQDPLMARDGEPHRLRVYGEEYRANVDALIEWYDELDDKPDVLLIHQHGLAERLLEHLEASGDDRRLIVLAGHSHRPEVQRIGEHVLVDAGTLGAGGPFAIGEQYASFAQLQFHEGDLIAVDLVRVDPISGSASSDRTLISPT